MDFRIINYLSQNGIFRMLFKLVSKAYDDHSMPNNSRLSHTLSTDLLADGRKGRLVKLMKMLL